MISRFSQFLVEEEKICYWTFGRMNPPTVGHEKLLDKLASKAGKNTTVLVALQSLKSQAMAKVLVEEGSKLD